MMSHKLGDRVRIGSGRVVWRVMHSDTNSAGRVLVEAESSRRMTTADPSLFRAVR